MTRTRREGAELVLQLILLSPIRPTLNNGKAVHPWSVICLNNGQLLLLYRSLLSNMGAAI